MSESDLYLPVKQFLEGQGYLVKGEIGACDMVAVRGEDPPVIVELKTNLNLALLLQGVDRLALSEVVYVAFAVGKGRSATWRKRKKQVTSLLRRLGLGLLTVSSDGHVVAVLDPAPYRPRISKHRRHRLLKEFSERVGDPEQGGSPSRPRLTAYRQDALRCANALSGVEALELSELRQRTGIARAGRILRSNYYGWFDRVSFGRYALSPKGTRALEQWVEQGWMPA